jgi:hypothetical protein
MKTIVEQIVERLENDVNEGRISQISTAIEIVRSFTDKEQSQVIDFAVDCGGSFCEQKYFETFNEGEENEQ